MSRIEIDWDDKLSQFQSCALSQESEKVTGFLANVKKLV